MRKNCNFIISMNRSSRLKPLCHSWMVSSLYLVCLTNQSRSVSDRASVLLLLPPISVTNATLAQCLSVSYTVNVSLMMCGQCCSWAVFQLRFEERQVMLGDESQSDYILPSSYCQCIDTCNTRCQKQIRFKYFKQKGHRLDI